MKDLIFLLTFFVSFNLSSQEEISLDEQQREVQEVQQADEEQKNETGEEMGEEITSDTKSQKQQDKIQVECVCPQSPVPAPSEEQAEEAPQIFPSNSVFNITPAPEAQPVEDTQKQEFDLPPGYLQKLPPGFSNDQYKRIEPY